MVGSDSCVALSVTSIWASTSSSSRQQLSVTAAVNETVRLAIASSTSTGCGSFVMSQLIVGGAVILD